jgi:hypothetical protein
LLLEGHKRGSKTEQVKQNRRKENMEMKIDQAERILVTDVDWKSRDQKLRVDLRMRESGDSYTSCGIRVMRPGQHPDEEGKWFATPSGIGIPIRLLRPLIAALEKASRMAAEKWARERKAAPECPQEGEALPQ